jgi:hypothetical protein
MENLTSENSIVELKNQQTLHFITNVQDRNKTEARLIIAKYDLHNSIRNILEKSEENSKLFNVKFQEFLRKRQEFIDFMTNYL